LQNCSNFCAGEPPFCEVLFWVVVFCVVVCVVLGLAPPVCGDAAPP
jgi:hypothetical protein